MLRLEDSVILLSYVDDTALQWLCPNCRVFLCPPHFEGFGLPVAEAMCLGATVAGSNASSLREAMGQAGNLVEPLDVDASARCIHSLGEDQESVSELGAKTLAQGARVSWRTLPKRL